MSRGTWGEVTGGVVNPLCTTLHGLKTVMSGFGLCLHGRGLAPASQDVPIAGVRRRPEGPRGG